MPVALPVVSPQTYAKFNACIHCGLCLPACPTYVETQDEADSPRGRIHLMKAAVDGRIGGEEGFSDAVFEHLDRCLVCRACETACPSGVVYHDLIEAVRPQIAEAVLGRERRLRSRGLQWIITHVLPYPKRLAAAMIPLKVAGMLGLGRLMPAAEGAIAMSRGAEPAFPVAASDGMERRGRVVLLRGCVGSVLSHDVNRACAAVLSRNGFDVEVLAEEPCCGALAAHGNDPGGARDWAARMVDALAGREAEYFISPIAGCGAQLKSLGQVLADTPGYVEKARAVAGRMRDISEFLVETGPRVPRGRIERTVTYHDPCHLVHAQRAGDAPRKILGMIPGLRVVALAESDMCCGAAGTYNLTQPAMAQRLGRRKAERILATSAEEVITANIGCALQIARYLREAGRAVAVRHVVELLAESYAREEPLRR